MADARQIRHSAPAAAPEIAGGLREQPFDTELAAVIHQHLCDLLQHSLEPSWLMVDPELRQLRVLTVAQALAELIH